MVLTFWDILKDHKYGTYVLIEKDMEMEANELSYYEKYSCSESW